MPDGQASYNGIRRVTEFNGSAKKVNDDGIIDRNDHNSNEAMHLISASNGSGQSLQRFSRLFDIVMMGTITPVDD